MTNPPPSRATWLGAATLVALVAIARDLLLDRRMVDLDVYRMGGAAILQGLPLYEQRLDGDGLPFTYPPFAAMVMSPLVLPPAELVYVAWTALSVAALAAVVARSLPPGSIPVRLLWFTPLLGLCALVEPVQRTFHFGQVNLLLCAMVLLDIARRDGRNRGVLLGLAAGIKLTPLFFFAFLIVTRQWQALRTASLTFAGTVALPFAILPTQAWQFWSHTVGDTGRIGTVFSVSNQSVMGFLRRTGVVDEWERPLWFLLAAAVGVVILLVARHHWEHGRAVTAVSLCGLGMTFASPISWSHHWVWAVPLALSLLNASPSSARFRPDPVAIAFLSVFALRMVWWAPHEGDAELMWSPLTGVLGNVYLVAGLVLLAVCSARVLRTGRTATIGKPASGVASLHVQPNPRDHPGRVGRDPLRLW